MAIEYSYPRLTPGRASNTKQFNSCNNKLRGDGILEMLLLLKPSCTNSPIQSKHAPIQHKHSNKTWSNASHCTNDWTFKWTHTPSRPLKSLLSPPTATSTYQWVGACRNNQNHVNYSALMVGRGRRSLTQPVWNLGPSANLWASYPALVKAEAGPEPGCHDPNPQLSECSAKEREVCWHGKHSLGHKWSQGVGLGLEPMLLNIPRNQRFLSLPLLPLLDFLPCHNIWVLKSFWRKNKNIYNHNNRKCSYLSVNDAWWHRAFYSAVIKVMQHQ